MGKLMPIHRGGLLGDASDLIRGRFANDAWGASVVRDLVSELRRETKERRALQRAAKKRVAKKR